MAKLKSKVKKSAPRVLVTRKPKPSTAAQRVLATRKTAGEMLDCSIDKIKELERDGLLTKVRLGRRPRGQVHLIVDELLALAGGKVDA